MLENACIIPSATYGITLHGEGSYFAFLDETGVDYLMFVTLREEQNLMVINNMIGGTWGKELHLGIPPKGTPERHSFQFKFNGDWIEIWNTVAMLEFQRFDKRCADRTRFLRLMDATNSNNALKVAIGSLESAVARIDAHLLHRRIDAIERRAGGDGPDLLSDRA